ncbi:SusC/RagA family TonB-linked outer membrane protein [Sphingobacteriaceae bacterium GW460-11-11-14-LB5]|nr:SusC/RagA family TonB-linked outer membrane protein [Sphingobacteriaceae bacterium GW460-11-11-14-LB5]
MNFFCHGQNIANREAIPSIPIVFKIMKLVILLTFVLQLGVFANSKAQQVNISVKNLPLKEVFTELNKQTKYRFLYKEESIQKVAPVTFNISNADINVALTRALKNSGLGFNIHGETITIIELRTKATEVTVEVRGTVKDSLGMPLPGVTVQVKGKPNLGAATDLDGEFKIKNVPEGSILEFRLVGFVTKEVPLNGKTIVNVILKQDNSNLNDVVVVGFGKQKKSSIVSSVSSVKGEALRFPTRSLTNAIAGQVPGIIAIQRSGEPGYDNAEFWIRGVSSFAGGTNPLILVDGIPRAMSDIEPDEIETFNVLKDAAATAVYGAEGANGVILITSKRGIVQKTKITYRGEYSQNEPTKLPEFMDSYDYLFAYNEALRNEDSPVFKTDAQLALYKNGSDRDLYPNTKFLDEMLRNTSYNTRHTLNFRGGGDVAKFFVSGAYYQENGIFKSNPNNIYDNNLGLKRYNLRSNIDLNVTKTTILGVDLSGQYLLTNYPGTGTATIFSRMMGVPGYLFPTIYSDGTIAGHPGIPSSNRVNPYNLLMESGYAKEWRTTLQSKLSLDQKLDFITKGLSFRGVVSFDATMNYLMNRLKSPKQFYASSRDANGKLIFAQVGNAETALGEPVESSNGQKNIYLESSLNYNRVFANDHTVGAMLLTYQKEAQQQGEALAFKKQAYVGRITYNYANRYSIEGNFGITGSEAFSPENRFGFFPAVGGAWFASNEPFYPEALKNIVSSLKFRASVGKTGNDNTGGARFLYRGTYTTGTTGYPIGIGGTGSLNSLTSIIEGRFEAPDLTWEIENKKNYGVDMELFRGAVDISVDYFNNIRSSILLQRRTVSGVTGFRQSPWQNFGSVSNKGMDGSINIRQNIGQVKLTARGNLTIAKNKILEIDELAQPYPWMNQTGTSIGQWNLYTADGLYADNDFTLTTDAAGKRTYTLKNGLPVSTLGGAVRPGDIKYKDLNGDGKIDNFDRSYYAGGDPANPGVVYGFGLNAEFKGFYGSIFFQGVAKTSTVFGQNAAGNFFPFAFGVEESNLRTEASNRWSESNPSQDVMFPRLHSISFANNQVASTWWLRDASFIRLKNIELGYRFPKKMLQKIGFETGRIYVMGNNIAVWDSIKMWDPELGNANEGLNYPIPRSYTIGLEFNL